MYELERMVATEAMAAMAGECRGVYERGGDEMGVVYQARGARVNGRLDPNEYSDMTKARRKDERGGLV